ncbi:MAG: OsmC family protein [Candidatus Bathyarchaeia archaeon]|nr:OsmC family protein [Candidatus Bathyarchaeota archaeon]
MSEERPFRVELSLEKGFRFRAEFGLEGVPSLYLDEPKPLGEGSGPNASMLLAAAVGNCLSASLLYCLRRSRIEVSKLEAKAEGIIARNERGRWRVKELSVELNPIIEGDHQKEMERCIGIFEDFCIVTESIRKGIPVKVKINYK